MERSLEKVAFGFHIAPLSAERLLRVAIQGGYYLKTVSFRSAAIKAPALAVDADCTLASNPQSQRQRERERAAGYSNLTVGVDLGGQHQYSPPLVQASLAGTWHGSGNESDDDRLRSKVLLQGGIPMSCWNQFYTCSIYGESAIVWQ